jgi:hypothetical protein
MFSLTVQDEGLVVALSGVPENKISLENFDLQVVGKRFFLSIGFVIIFFGIIIFFFFDTRFMLSCKVLV